MIFPLLPFYRHVGGSKALEIALAPVESLDRRLFRLERQGLRTKHHTTFKKGSNVFETTLRESYNRNERHSHTDTMNCYTSRG
jgi:hypothetical protein